MATVSRTFEVRPSPDVVVDYLKDFSHATEWDPGTDSCERIDDGEIAVGSRWANTSTIAGVSTDLTYELTELSARRIQFVGRNESASSTDTITVEAHGAGTQITYEAVIEMSGAAKLADPVMKLVFEKIGSDTEGDMVQVLNRLGDS